MSAYTDPGDFERTATRNRKRAAVATDTAALDLFGTPPTPKPARGAPYQASSDTSREAAERIQPQSSALREHVYDAVASMGSEGATRKDVEAITGYLTQTVCPRLNELEHARRVRKLTTLTGDGEIATVKRQSCAVYVALGSIR